eukprot:scaffold1229_cov287-Pinguiococcus_pyrenoidosus.AAC.1
MFPRDLATSKRGSGPLLRRLVERCIHAGESRRDRGAAAYKELTPARARGRRFKPTAPSGWNRLVEKRKSWWEKENVSSVS